MHRKLHFRKGAIITGVSMLLFMAACKPAATNALSNADDNSGYESDASRIELYTDDAISIADAAGNLYNGADIGPSVTVGTDTIDNPHTLVIRFGPTDVVCYDGRPRRGSIIVTYNGNYIDTAQAHIITFSNYYLNDNQVTGSIQTTRVDTTVVGDWYYNVLVNDSINMSPDPLNSQYVVWSGNLVHKWLSGFNTQDREDDAYSISGNTTLTRANGHVFYCAISSPLQVAINCNYVESGVIDVSGYLSPTRVVNYGTDGNCTGSAQVTIGSSTYGIALVK